MRQSLILILIITIISACILIFAIRAAHPFTWEGELDPNEFLKWPRVSQRMVSPEIGTVTVKNPDASSPIQNVQVILKIYRITCSHINISRMVRSIYIRLIARLIDTRENILPRHNARAV